MKNDIIQNFFIIALSKAFIKFIKMRFMKIEDQ